MYTNNSLTRARLFARQSILVALLLSPVSLINCGSLLESDSDDNEGVALLAAALVSQCSIGGVNFVASGGVSCSLNNASGTGTLTAVQNRTDFVSMLLNFQLNASNASLSLVGGQNPANGTVSSGSNGEIQITPLVSKKPQDAGAGAAGASTTAQSWCLEMHLQETPVHVMIDQVAACTAKAATSATYENDANGSGSAGGAWGFVLNNATITGITLNNQKLFTE